MVNLHIGGAISVFIICVGLLGTDRWLNKGEEIDPQITESDAGRLESAEFVIAPPTQFYFSQQPSANPVKKVSEALWFPSNSKIAKRGDSRLQSIQPKLAPDHKLFAADVELK
jgi:hypothetical protein